MEGEPESTEDVAEQRLPAIALTRFIHEAATKLGLTELARATAMSLYHRFRHSKFVDDLDHHTVAVTLMYLSSKVEESPIDLRDVITTSFRVLHKSQPFLKVGDLYYDLRDSVTCCELVLLRLFDFKVHGEHPFKHVLSYCASLATVLENDKDLADITQTAWTFLNDSYHTDISLLHSPDVIALAVVHLAALVLGIRLPDNGAGEWFLMFNENISQHDLESAGAKLLAFYEQERKSPPTPTDVEQKG